MNQATADKLKKNPHYKPSPQQRAEIQDDGPVQTFGQIPKNNISVEKHPTGPRKVPQSRR